MTLFEDLKYVTLKVLKMSGKNIKHNPLLLILVMVYSFLYSFLVGMSYYYLGSGMLTSLIIDVLIAAFASSFFYQVRVATNNYKIESRDFRESFSVYFPQILIFIFFLTILLVTIDFVLVLFVALSPALAIMLKNLAIFALFIVLNPVPEVIYITRRTAVDAFSKSIAFVKENPASWFIPNLIFFGLYVVIINQVTRIFFNIFKFRSFLVFTTWTQFLVNLVGSLLIAAIFVYRANLFDILNTSTRRKRAYQKKLEE